MESYTCDTTWFVLPEVPRVIGVHNGETLHASNSTCAGLYVDVYCFNPRLDCFINIAIWFGAPIPSLQAGMNEQSQTQETRELIKKLK